MNAATTEPATPSVGLALTTVSTRVLERAEWRAREAAHAERVDRTTEAHRQRRADGRGHPVEDFLFTYYRTTPGQLRRWHPGAGVRLEDAAGTERAGWRFSRVVCRHVELDSTAYLTARGGTVDFVRRLVASTAGRPAQLGCFGMHEWAMVYRLSPDQVRHADWPLRLGAEGTDTVVESRQITCTHYDAFRFYTPPARSLNLVQPSRERQVELEQPGCLHAGMDLYKWATKLSPAVPSELVTDCFEHARAIRELDMRASPYDLRELGYEPVRVETPAGRAEYAAAQRDFAARGQRLRERLLQALAVLDGSQSAAGSSPSGRAPRSVVDGSVVAGSAAAGSAVVASAEAAPSSARIR